MKRIRLFALGVLATIAFSSALPTSADAPVYLNHGTCSATGTTIDYSSSTQGVTFGGTTGCLAGLDFFWQDPVLGGWYANGFQAGYTYLSSSVPFQTNGQSWHSIKQDGMTGADSAYSYTWT